MKKKLTDTSSSAYSSPSLTRRTSVCSYSYDGSPTIRPLTTADLTMESAVG